MKLSLYSYQFVPYYTGMQTYFEPIKDLKVISNRTGETYDIVDVDEDYVWVSLNGALTDRYPKSGFHLYFWKAPNQ